MATLFSKAHYELMAQFERQFKSERLDREDKSYWPSGNVYQDGQVNKLFLAFRSGAAYGSATTEESSAHPSSEPGWNPCRDVDGATCADQFECSTGRVRRAPIANRLHDLIDRYWSLAYAEGKEGREHDTEDGAAQQCRHEIEVILRGIAGVNPCEHCHGTGNAGVKGGSDA